jgi:Holliday junction resolvasome RuvABC endonuclease subunit
MSQKRRVYIGIDPGKSGAIAAVVTHNQDTVINWHKLDSTEADTWAFLDELDNGDGNTFAVIEKVGAMPSFPGKDGKRRQMGAATMFTFGKSAGFLLGILTASQIPFEYVTPQTWQKSMGCMSKGDKNVTKAAAQRLFPREKITHANADALLIAEYCRRMRGDK